MQGASDQRLINIAEAYSALLHHGKKLSTVPGTVPDLDNQWVVAEALAKVAQSGSVLGRAMERMRELQQYSPEPLGVAERRKPFAYGMLVFRCYAGFVRKFFPKLSREHK